MILLLIFFLKSRCSSIIHFFKCYQVTKQAEREREREREREKEKRRKLTSITAEAFGMALCSWWYCRDHEAMKIG